MVIEETGTEKNEEEYKEIRLLEFIVGAAGTGFST